MEKIIGLKEQDFEKLEQGYNFIKENREIIYDLIKVNEELSAKFAQFFPSKKGKALDISLLGL